MGLEQDDLKKLNQLKALPREKFQDREWDFIVRLHEYNRPSMAQLTWLQKLYDRLVSQVEKARDKTRLILGDRISAYRVSTGWQIYVDHKATGVVMARSDVHVVAQWLNLSLESLELVLRQPKPVVVSGGMRTEEKVDGNDCKVSDQQGGQDQSSKVGHVEDDWEAIYGL